MNLDTPCRLTPDQVARFQRDGYIKLQNVLDAATLDHYDREITGQVLKLNRQAKPMHERTTYEKAFLQVMNLWRQSDVVKEFVFSRRLAQPRNKNQERDWASWCPGAVVGEIINTPWNPVLAEV